MIDRLLKEDVKSCVVSRLNCNKKAFLYTAVTSGTLIVIQFKLIQSISLMSKVCTDRECFMV